MALCRTLCSLMLRRRDFMKWLLIFFTALHLGVSPLDAADKPFIPDPAKFAPMAKARYLSGELVYMDAVNRRGGIRIDGGESGRYWAGRFITSRCCLMRRSGKTAHGPHCATCRWARTSTAGFSCRPRARRTPFRRFRIRWATRNSSCRKTTL